MSALLDKMKAFIKDESGLTMVEYAVAGGLITLAAVTAFTNLGQTVAGVIGNIDTTLQGSLPAGG